MFKVIKIVDPKHRNPIKSTKQARNSNFSRTCPSKCCCHGKIQPYNPNYTTSLNCQISLRKFKVLQYGRTILNCLKLHAILSWCRHQKPPPSPRWNRVKSCNFCIKINNKLLNQLTQSQSFI